MTLNPLKDHVVAKKQQPEEKTKSGILLGAAKETPAYLIIESVGPDVKSVKKGDKIIVKDYTGTEIELDGTKYSIIEEKDILATL